MFALVANLDPFAAGADEVHQRRIQIERVAHLIEVGDLQIRTLANLATVRLQFTQDQFQQRGLAGAIRTNQPDLVATYDGGRKVLDDDLVAKGLAGFSQLGHQFATQHACSHIHAHLADNVPMCGATGAQFFQPHDATLAARAARFNAFPDPDLFLRQQLVRLGADDRFLRQLLFLENQILSEIAIVGTQNPAIQLDDARRHPIQESPVMGDGDHAALECHQQFFQPFNRIQIEVVGRLIEQQDVRLCHQRLRQGHPLLGAA